MDIEEIVLESDNLESTPTDEVTEETTELEVVEENTEPTEGQEQTETTEETPQMIKVKYNHEEREITLDEAKELAQKGMNYDKQLEKLQQLESDPRLKFVESLATQNDMTVDEYIDAVKVQREQEEINQLIQQNIPEDIAKELLENRKFRESYKKEKETTEQQGKQEAEFKDFLSSFPDVEADKIPAEVWEKNSQGVPLKYAYMEHINNELQSKMKVLEQNKNNKEKAPIGSITTHGSTDNVVEDDFDRGFNSI